MSSILQGLRNSGKGLLVGGTIATFAAKASFSRLSHRKDDDKKRREALRLTASHCKKFLELLNVKVDYTPPPQSLGDKNYFMVCNHMSYVDILVLSSCRPSVFVTSVEMEKTFFLGDLAKLGGSFFVNRINRRKMRDEVEALKGLVARGFDVFIFPEGTSTNGVGGLLPFKKSLFRVPFQAEIPILPICLKYKTIDGEPFSAANCDRVTWHGDMSFAPHLHQMLSLKDVRATVEYFDPIDSTQFADHGALAAAAHRVVETAYGDPSQWT